MTLTVALITFIVGLLAGALMIHRDRAPKLARLEQQLQVQRTATQDAEAKWLELVSLLDDNGQLPKDAAAKIRQLIDPTPTETESKLTERSGSSSHRCAAELARIKAGQPSLDSLEGMSSSHSCSVLLARIKAGQPLQHSLEELSSSHRAAVELACAKAGIEL